MAQISLFEGTSEKTAPSSEESEILFKGKSISIGERGHFKVLRLKEDRIGITLISEILRQELLNMITSLEKFQPEGEGRNVPVEPPSGKEVGK